MREPSGVSFGVVCDRTGLANVENPIDRHAPATGSIDLAYRNPCDRMSA